MQSRFNRWSRREPARRRCITSEVDNPRFQKAISRFDAENARDPNHQTFEGEALPRELLHARRLTDWLLKLEPNASEILRLAARSQHICRWKVPRSEFPADRIGYHRWKNHLKRFHADLTGRILRECGYPDETVEQVQALNLKTNFPHDPECQTLEDALCLVFLELQFSELAARSDREKMVNALRKSWAKMSPRARAFALTLKYARLESELIAAALS